MRKDKFQNNKAILFSESYSSKNTDKMNKILIVEFWFGVTVTSLTRKCLSKSIEKADEYKNIFILKKLMSLLLVWVELLL